MSLSSFLKFIPRYTWAITLFSLIYKVGFTYSCFALEVSREEQKEIKECERKLCTVILGKKIEGEDLKCILSKTWDRDTIRKGETNSVHWGFGDARCSVNLHIKRHEILSSITKKEYTAEVPVHDINCLIEMGGEENAIAAKAAPKLIFKDGKAEKIWINLSDMKGPITITSPIWMIAELEDKFGIFHKKMVKSVNKFIEEKCPKNYDADGSPKSKTSKNSTSKKDK